MATARELRSGLAIAALALTLGGLPVLAQSRGEAVVLSEGSPTAQTTGSTNGLLALSNIAGRDRRGLICAGFADSEPSHIMVLQQDFTALTLQVNSGGNDTSLLVQGPDGSVRCGQDSDRRNPDARIQDQAWTAGTYRVWVGSHHQGQRYTYTLNVGP